MNAASNMLTYKFRMHPTRRQVEVFEETTETCRRLYNHLLSDRIENGNGYYVQQRNLVAMKMDNKYLRSVHSQVLQDVVLGLDKSFARFFSGISRYPRFKRVGRYKSFTYPQFIKSFNIEGNSIKLGKIGKVKVRFHREVIGDPKTATVIREIDQ